MRQLRRGEHINGFDEGFDGRQASSGCFLDPFLAVAITGEEHTLVVMDDIPADLQGFFPDVLQVFDAVKLIRDLVEGFRHDGIQNRIRER